MPSNGGGSDRDILIRIETKLGNHIANVSQAPKAAEQVNELVKVLRDVQWSVEKVREICARIEADGKRAQDVAALTAAKRIAWIAAPAGGAVGLVEVAKLIWGG